MTRALATAAVVLISSSIPAQGQAALEASTEDGAIPSPAASRAGQETAAFGLSGAIRVVLAEPGEPIGPGVVEGAGEGWEAGHRWTLLHGQWAEPEGGAAAAPAVLGEPAAPVQDVDLELCSAPAGSVLGDPTDSLPLNPNDSIVAPADPGVWVLESGTGAAMNVVTQVPASLQQDGLLNGYHIGNYPTAGSDRLDAYAPPAAFIEVTPESRDFRVSEHLSFGQFLTKDQFDVWPKYVALDLRLIDKLELVIAELHVMGVRADHMHVMSGFRTPQYNGPGGDGRASLSRHMWGDAADVWIDSDQDGQMDDLNGDGSIDMDDAAVVMRAVERVERKYPELIGGAGTYPTTPTHGPYIHIDARGHHSRW